MYNIRSLKNTVIMSKSDIYRAAGLIPARDLKLIFRSCSWLEIDLFLSLYIYVYMNDECITECKRTRADLHWEGLVDRKILAICPPARRSLVVIFPLASPPLKKRLLRRLSPIFFKNLTPLFATNANMAHITSTYYRITLLQCKNVVKMVKHKRTIGPMHSAHHKKIFPNISKKNVQKNHG
jgi:hypothetical protein